MNTTISRAGFLLVWLAGALSTGDAYGADGGRDRSALTLEAVRVTAGPPALTGRLDHPAWRAAPVATGFIQMRPEPGAPASQRTEVRVLYDDEAVYVGMRMYDDEPDGIAGPLARRDASGIHSDWAHVLIDSYHDRRTAFRFSANPLGVQRDVLHFDDFGQDVNWDGVWEVATSIDDLGWIAEFRIPLSQLRFTGNGGPMVWGVNFGREIARHSEWSWWAPVVPDVPRMVSAAGELHGIRDLKPPRRLEVLPYLAARGAREPVSGSNPFQPANGVSGNVAVGADLRYGLSSNLTLSATLNPDFGQVEADPSVVNLTAQETFYAERRPFFVEGSNIFTYNIGYNDNSGEGLFYTRRIGRAPQRGLGGLGPHADRPDATRILGAAKVSGRTANGWSIGLLEAVTAREVGTVLTWDQLQETRTVEPLTNYAIARATRDFRAGSSQLGFMATSTHRRLEDDPGLAFLADRAYTGGVDFRHQFANNAWSLSGWMAGSHVAGDTLALQRLQRSPLRYMHRPDADHVSYDPHATALSGYGGTLNLWKMSGNWRGGMGGTTRSPGFEVNDAGFQSAADLTMVYGNLRYHRFEPLGPFRNFMVGVNPSASWTYGGEQAHAQLNLFSNYELQSNWSFGFWSARVAEGLSTGALRGGPALVRPGGWQGNLWVNSDSRRPVRVNAYASGGVDDEAAGWRYSGGLNLTWRPSGRLDLRAGPNYSERKSESQYVGQPMGSAGERQYLFGAIHQRTASLTARLNYTLTPNLSVQLYAQPFVSAGSYSGFRVATDTRADRFAQRFHRFGPDEIRFEAGADGQRGRYLVEETGAGNGGFTFGQPDFNVKELRSNLVVRWEYRPGSTLFVVWSQGRSHMDPTGAFNLAHDFERLLGAPSSNVVAIKLNYWLNL
jgi:hypothetical protein